MTPAQARALDAVSRGEVWMWKGGLRWHMPKGIHASTLNRLLEEGLLSFAKPEEADDLEWVDVGLSDPGRAELEAIVA